MIGMESKSERNERVHLSAVLHSRKRIISRSKFGRARGHGTPDFLELNPQFDDRRFLNLNTHTLLCNLQLPPSSSRVLFLKLSYNNNNNTVTGVGGQRD